MANTQHTHVLLFILLVTACLETQFAEGRQLKAMKKHKSKVETGLKKLANQATKVERSQGNQKIDPRIAQQKNVSPPTAPAQSHKLNSSDVSRKDASQTKTTQGNSPGVGHSFPGKIPNMQPTEQDFKATSGKTDAFQAKTQAHSPGVGHSFGN